jgi:uncharacterized membrane protein SirB2
MNFLLLKQAHISFALLSISGFVLRWTWVMMRSRWSHHRLTKSAFTLGQYPFHTDWLTAKVTGLLAYILLGMAAMSKRASRTGKVVAFLAAVFSYAWIVSVALSKSPWGFLG